MWNLFKFAFKLRKKRLTSLNEVFAIIRAESRRTVMLETQQVEGSAMASESDKNGGPRQKWRSHRDENQKQANVTCCGAFIARSHVI